MSDASRLPARPSLEQLHKQAKDLLRAFRAGDAAVIDRFRAVSARLLAPDRSEPVTLADAQFVLAREHGFESWAKLKHHIEELHPPGLEQYERLARDVAAAYSSGDAEAIREINWNLGTSFVHYRDPVKMQQRLGTWFAAEKRTPELALADARGIVAHAYGFESWAKFAASIAKPPADPRSAPPGISSTPPFYKLDRKENAISVRGPMSGSDWDRVCDVIKEHGITRLNAGGMTDEGMDRVTRIEHVTKLYLGDSNRLTDAGVRCLARMPQLEELDLSGWKGVITDRGLAALRDLPRLKRFQMCWQQNISDAGVANLERCEHLETVDLMGTPAGDGAIAALAGKRRLGNLKTGRNVTDAGLALLHRFPVFKEWQGGEIRYGLMSAGGGPNHLSVDGPFSDAGIAGLVGLDGLFALSFFWHCSFTGAALEPLKHLPRLGMLGCDGKRCDDEAMRHIAALPGLRMLMAQGTVASDAGFEALSRSRSLEYIWGRECPHLTGRGFEALATMPALRGLALSCKNVSDEALSRLSRFPALRELVPMDVPDEGFRHVGRCEAMERLWCMYCRDTGDAATGHLAGLPALRTYYAGETQITDRSLEILGRMRSLESLEFWSCRGITDAGVAHLAGLPRLREITLDGLPGVSVDAAALFPAHVRVNYSG